MFVVLALLSVLGIVFTQVFWFKRSYDINEQEFNKNLNIALKEVVKGILKYNNTQTAPAEPVKQLERNFFAVLVNDHIDADVLEFYLKSELRKFNIEQAFEYSIYDCQNKTLIFGDSSQTRNLREKLSQVLPQPVGDNYYFTLYFPYKAAGIVGHMGVWLYSSAVLLVVVLFFGYSLFVILRQKRLSEIQRDFINNMTHEFKTPLSTIAISAQTLKSPEMLTQPQRLLNYATIIQDEAERLKNHVERVLSVAGNQSGPKLNREPTDLHRLMEESARALILQSPKQITLHLHLNASNHILNCDRLHMINVVSNLIDNSIKYSGENLEITLSTVNIRNQIELRFADTGIGISKEHQKHVFDKFYRVPTGNRHDVKGFGLGLNYVQVICRAHKGNINVQSETGKGTTFIITLPLS